MLSKHAFKNKYSPSGCWRKISSCFTTNALTEFLNYRKACFQIMLSKTNTIHLHSLTKDSSSLTNVNSEHALPGGYSP